MALPLAFNNTVYQAGFVGTDDGAPSATFQIDDASRSSLTVNGTVNAVGDPITVTGILPGATTSSTTTFYATQFDNASMVQFTNAQSGANSSSTRLILSNSQVFGSGTANRTRFTSDGDTSLNSYAAPVCFTTGTLIRTTRGDVAVEDLSIGDLVVTSSGEERPIRWIGHRTLNCSKQGRLADVLPIRIAAGAFDENKPSQDLLVSPGHSLCFDVLGEVLVMASALVNDTTITQEAVETVTYWHVELDSHDILIANNQPAESYLDVGTRAFFSECTVVRVDAVPDPDRAELSRGDLCRPFHETGVIVEAVRARIQARAAQANLAGAVSVAKPTYLVRAPGPLQGHLDRCEAGVVQGWAFDAANPDMAVCLEVVVDGVVVGLVDADQYRWDVRAAGFGGGRSGFHFALPHPLALVDVVVRRAVDGAMLGITSTTSRLAA